MVAAGLNTTQTISVAVGGVVALGVIIAIFNVWSSYLHERRRTQPVVIAHERHGRQFSDNPSYLAVGGYITNDGGGPAFNVRFGVEFGGVRYPQKQFPHDPDSGNVERVLPVNQRRPAQNASPDSWPILIPQQSLIGTTGSDELDDSRVYWARYENTIGKTWETHNPWDRSARLRIRRVHALRLREWREQRRREKVGVVGAALVAEAMEQFREAARQELRRRGIPLLPAEQENAARE